MKNYRRRLDSSHCVSSSPEENEEGISKRDKEVEEDGGRFSARHGDQRLGFDPSLRRDGALS